MSAGGTTNRQRSKVGTLSLKKKRVWTPYCFKVTSSTYFHYFDGTDTNKAKGQILLHRVERIEILGPASGPGYPFAVHFGDKNSPWVLSAASDADRASWIETIKPGSLAEQKVVPPSSSAIPDLTVERPAAEHNPKRRFPALQLSSRAFSSEDPGTPVPAPGGLPNPLAQPGKGGAPVGKALSQPPPETSEPMHGIPCTEFGASVDECSLSSVNSIFNADRLEPPLLPNHTSLRAGQISQKPLNSVEVTFSGSTGHLNTSKISPIPRPRSVCYLKAEYDIIQDQEIPLLENTPRVQISLPENSQRGQMPLPENSQRGQMPLLENSQRGQMPLPENSHRGQIPLPENSHRGQMPLPENSHRGQIPLPEVSHQRQVPLPENSQRGQIPLPENSYKRQISLQENSHRGQIPLPENAYREGGVNETNLDGTELSNIAAVTDRIKGLPPDQLQKLLIMVKQMSQTLSPEAMLEQESEEVLENPDSSVELNSLTSLLEMEQEAIYIPSSALSDLVSIGHGQFGEVFKAILHKGTPGEVEVAVKTTKKNSTDKERADFMKEMTIMSTLLHPNIVRFYGIAHTAAYSDLIVLEYLPFGDLKSYLTKNSPSRKQLVKYMIDVAVGMQYISGKGLVHRDLAARNILVGENETCKVADFGLLRELPEDSEIYFSMHNIPCPIKWMSPESIDAGKFSVASDVWSFGILMWEMFNPSKSPYQGMTNMECAVAVCKGYRLPLPRGIPDVIAKIMQSCWHEKPSKRPSFLVIVSLLTSKAHEMF